MRFAWRSLLVPLSALFLIHCAKGSEFVDPGDDGDGGEGGSETTGAGAGTTGAGAGTTGAGAGTTGAGAGTTGAGAGTTTTTSSSSSSTTSSTTSSSTTSSSTTTSSSSSSTTTSSSTTADCNPLSPGAVCGANQHCVPTASGDPFCQGPVGAGGQYSACLDVAECQAAFNCIDTGDPDIFALPCCLQWCTGDLDCPLGATCYALTPAVYAGATEYGVCYDGLGGC